MNTKDTTTANANAQAAGEASVTLEDILPLTKTGRFSPSKKLDYLTEDETSALVSGFRSGRYPEWLILERARSGRAAKAFGVTWREFVEEYCGISESRAFQHMDHARVMVALAAAGLNPFTVEPIPARVVARIKSHPDEVTRVAREAISAGEDLGDALRGLAAEITLSAPPTAPRRTRQEMAAQRNADLAFNRVRVGADKDTVSCPSCAGTGVVSAEMARGILMLAARLVLQQDDLR